MLLSLPVSGYFILQGGYVIGELTASLHIVWLVAGMGLLSALALGFQALSAPCLI